MTDCCRFNNLVYARTLKAGSEFFYKNFTQTAGWRPMKLEEVDWNYHTVFSYIMDPIHRRHKGISEVIIQTHTADLLLNNKGNFSNLLKQVPYLDGHSASLHAVYGNNVNKINWLLMTNDHSVAIEETNRFLAEHSAPPVEWNTKFTHATDSYMKEIFVLVKSLWENNPSCDDTVRNYFQKDIELFNQVKERYARDRNQKHS